LTIIDRLAVIAGEQISTRGLYAQAIEAKGSARDVLFVMLRDISDLATAMAYEMDGLEERFRRPRNRRDQNPIATGRAFAAATPAFRTQFVEYGMPATFIDDLTTAASEFEQSLVPASTAAQDKSGKTAAAVPLIDDGMIIVRRLTPIIRKKYRNNAENLAAWETARHVQRTTPKTNPQPVS
jgi:hypothetical protein